MTKVIINPGVCGFKTTVTSETNEDEEVVLKVSTGCASVKAMMDELGDTFDPIEVCLTKPGDNAFYEYARTHFPAHAACPIISGILKCMEVEGSLALPANASIEFLT